MEAGLLAIDEHGGGTRLQRARGRATVAFGCDDAGTSRLADLYQDGCAKIRLPNVYDDSGPVAVLINTAGGVTGGDRIAFEARWGDRATATVTTQAAERIYRRSAGVGRIDSRLVIGAGATARWLPQETIVFDRAALGRSLDIEMAGSATLIACESLVLGRTAMGEDVREAEISDRWRLRRDGRLVYADQLRLSGDTRMRLAGGATGNGARAIASLLVAAPDAEARRDGVRDLLAARLAGLDGAAEAGASAFDGLLSIRFLARDGRALRAILEPAIQLLTGHGLPRAWSV